MGYLTQDISKVPYPRSRTSYVLKFPNEEVVSAFRSDITEALKLDSGLKMLGEKAWKDIENQDIENLSNTFRDFMEENGNMLIYVSKDREALLKGAFETLLRITDHPNRVVRRDFVVGGKFDFALDYLHKNVGERQMLLEFKYLRSSEKEFIQRDIEQVNKYQVLDSTKYILNLDDEGISLHTTAQ